VELDGRDGRSIVAFTLASQEYRHTAAVRAGETLRLDAPVPLVLDPATLRGRRR